LKTIADPSLARLLADGSDPTLPPPVAAAAFRMTSLVLAARSWSTIGAVTTVWKLAAGRFAIPLAANGHFLSFAWDYDVNRAFELRLERIAPGPNSTGDP